MTHNRLARRAAAAVSAAVRPLAAVARASADTVRGPFVIVPLAAPRVAVAVGAGFPLVGRERDTEAPVDRWEVVRPRSAGFVYVRAASPVDGQRLVLDAQAPRQGVPVAGDPVGARPADFTLSQRWLLRRHGGRVRLVNVYSEQTLVWDATGAGFRQGSGEGMTADFVLHRP